jgi:predicted metalloprotease with PDZ domain
MARCAENPHFGRLSLSEAGGDVFFEDSDACNLVYHGGTLVAALLDREIRAAGKGLTLDHFMRAFNNDPRWSLESCPGMDDFESVLTEFVGAEQAARYRRLVEEPYILDPVREFERLEAPVERKKKGVFRRKLRFDVNPDPWRSHQAVN